MSCVISKYYAESCRSSSLVYILVISTLICLIFLHTADNGRDKNRTSGRLNNGIPQVPPRRGQSELDHFRRSLPVYERQDEIVQIIKDNRVVLVLGETGSGKTTQVCEQGSKSKIIRFS